MTEQDKINIFDALIKPFLCSDSSAWWNNPPLNGETVVNTSLRLDWDGCCEPPEKTIKLVQNGKILIEKGL